MTVRRIADGEDREAPPEERMGGVDYLDLVGGRFRLVLEQGILLLSRSPRSHRRRCRCWWRWDTLPTTWWRRVLLMLPSRPRRRLEPGCGKLPSCGGYVGWRSKRQRCWPARWSCSI